ncbi:NAD(P)H-dependent oxidoreductase [Sulfurimonas sp. HSL-3221]|uniref:NAD(P)H-dependent oxidoreductase n=1 Tax=Sulfurimonadaceae TaxID=2771471 RepID=UPI001E33CE66|nr:NAD(P)H-dependent oxidoreductase [Sulfurimonas sp. HSL-3221]UFS62659.1 NAD(P)H-dependent oxidoreductase [Sulfurimonas sp. HSL-3221]
MTDFADAMAFRHACKRFSDQQIPEATFEQVLEFGRMSPSSFGMEPWRFLVVADTALREALRPLCWNQPQITESSHLLIITADNECIKPGTEYVRAMFARRGLPEEAYERYLGVYADHMGPQFHSREAIEAWTHKQCYLAAANMMTGAASLQIDSCPIEGFEKAKVEALLAMEPARSVALIVAFGYRLNPQPEHYRLDLDDVVERR